MEQHNAGGKPESWVVDLRQYARCASLHLCFPCEMSIREGGAHDEHACVLRCSDLMALMKDESLTAEERATKANFYHAVCLQAGLLACLAN